MVLDGALNGIVDDDVVFDDWCWSLVVATDDDVGAPRFDLAWVMEMYRLFLYWVWSCWSFTKKYC